jgi:hypothetical protein
MKKMMMERMNSVKGNVRDRLEKVGEQGNVVGTCIQDVRKVGVNRNQTMTVGQKAKVG